MKKSFICRFTIAFVPNFLFAVLQKHCIYFIYSFFKLYFVVNFVSVKGECNSTVILMLFCPDTLRRMSISFTVACWISCISWGVILSDGVMSIIFTAYSWLVRLSTHRRTTLLTPLEKKHTVWPTSNFSTNTYSHFHVRTLFSLFFIRCTFILQTISGYKRGASDAYLPRISFGSYLSLNSWPPTQSGFSSSFVMMRIRYTGAGAPCTFNWTV